MTHWKSNIQSLGNRELISIGFSYEYKGEELVYKGRDTSLD